MSLDFRSADPDLSRDDAAPSAARLLKVFEAMSLEDARTLLARAEMTLARRRRAEGRILIDDVFARCRHEPCIRTWSAVIEDPRTGHAGLRVETCHVPEDMTRGEVEALFGYHYGDERILHLERTRDRERALRGWRSRNAPQEAGGA